MATQPANDIAAARLTDAATEWETIDVVDDDQILTVECCGWTFYQPANTTRTCSHCGVEYRYRVPQAVFERRTGGARR